MANFDRSRQLLIGTSLMDVDKHLNESCCDKAPRNGTHSSAYALRTRQTINVTLSIPS